MRYIEKIDSVDTLIQFKKEHLDEESSWTFLPPLFVAFLTMLLSIDILWSINSRVGNTTTIIQSKGSQYKDAALWLAINRDRNQLVVTGGEKQIFVLPLDVNSINDLEPLKKYIEETKYKVSRSTVLQRRAPRAVARVALSVDTSIQYKHITPILHLIAQSGFSQYSFEVRKTHDTSFD